MYDLISIGSISIDLYFKGDSLTYKDNRFQLAIGGKYVVDHFQESVGGSGANVAIGAQRNGLKTAAFGFLGDNPFQSMIKNKLIETKVSVKLLKPVKNYYNISSIFLSPKGERSIVHYITPHQHILVDTDSIKKLVNTEYVYLGNLPDVPVSEREVLLRVFKKNDITTIVNLGVADCRRPKHQLENMLRLTDILILNGHEFADLVKAPYKDLRFKENVVDWYIPELKNKLLIITEGQKGSYGYYKGKLFYQKAVQARRIIDTTGAGDAYCAAFIAEYSTEKNIEKSMMKASDYATRILEKIGAN